MSLRGMSQSVGNVSSPMDLGCLHGAGEMAGWREGLFHSIAATCLQRMWS